VLPNRVANCPARSYKVFAGRDASHGLATLSLKPEEADLPIDKLTKPQRKTLRERRLIRLVPLRQCHAPRPWEWSLAAAAVRSTLPELSQLSHTRRQWEDKYRSKYRVVGWLDGFVLPDVFKRDEERAAAREAKNNRAATSDPRASVRADGSVAVPARRIRVPADPHHSANPADVDIAAVAAGAASADKAGTGSTLRSSAQAEPSVDSDEAAASTAELEYQALLNDPNAEAADIAEAREKRETVRRRLESARQTDGQW
jgi:hypothetical protein